MSKMKPSNLSEFFQRFLRYNRGESTAIIDTLNSHHIYSLNDLQKLSSDGWSSLNSKIPSRVDEIKAEVDKIDAENLIDENFYKKSIFEQKSDWHKLKRYLYYTSDKENKTSRLKETGFLDWEALDASFENEKKVKTFNMGFIIDDIKSALENFTIEDHYQLHKNHGKFFIFFK